MSIEQAPQVCPVCQDGSFQPTADTFEIGKLLKMWEEGGAATFSPEVWQQYGSPAPQQVTLYRCAKCGFGMFQPVIVGSEAFYDGITTDNGNCYSAEKWEFIEAIKDIKRHGCHSVLDIASGSGYFLDLLRKSYPGVEYAGYEFNSKMVELARSKGHEMYYGTLPKAILEARGGQGFDAVCMFQIIEHVSDPVDFIKRALQLLNPNGLLLIGVPDSLGPVRHFSSSVTDTPPHHVSRWTEASFRLGMPKLGLKLLRAAYEPLPYYLWEHYLPVMLARDLRPTLIGRALHKARLVNPMIRILKLIHLRWLPFVPGHSLYVALEREDAGETPVQDN
jgi:SAM-dependent methyltransferase